MTGRPRKPIDQNEFEKLCGLQCTKAEIQGWFDVSDKTLDKWVKETYGVTFSVVFEQKRSSGKISIRRKQYEVAQKGNVTMLIWLGKQYLGQKDKHETDIGDNAKQVFELAYKK